MAITKRSRKLYYDTLAKVDYEFYVKYTNIQYKHGQHTKYICNVLNEVMRDKKQGKSRKLIVTMPPQHSKSYTITETFPSYYLGHNPNDNIIITGYSDTFAQKFGKRNKEKIIRYGPDIFKVKMSNKEADKEWEITGLKKDKKLQGRVLSSGIGGQITGEGADLLIIDDPIKNRQEAESIKYRQRLWEEWESTLSTRLSEDSVVIVIMTRWHEDDLAGRLLNKQNEFNFEELRLPALAEENDPIGREIGEPLWPDKFSKEYLVNRKESLSSKVWASLYNASPFRDEGQMFKSSDYNYFTETKNSYVLYNEEKELRVKQSLCFIFQTIDTSLKDKNDNAFTVMATWALTPNNNLLLLDIFRERLQVPDLYPNLIKQRLKWNPQMQYVEDKASGTGLIQKCKRKGKPVRPIQADNSKEIRAIDIATMYENGMVYHKKGTAWVKEYEDELNKFPDGEYDDQVDTASYAGIIVENNMLKRGGSKGFATST